MKPEDFVVHVPSSDDDRFALSVPRGGRIKSIAYLGGTIPTAANPFTDGDTFMFNPHGPGIIGLSVSDEKGKSHDFIVEVRLTDSKFFVALQEVYFPRAINTSYAFQNRQLRVRVGDTVFAASSYGGVDYIVSLPWLYQLLVGGITIDEAIAAAVAEQDEERERQLAGEALKEIQRIEEFLTVGSESSAFNAVVTLQHELNHSQAAIRRLDDSVRRARIIESYLLDNKLLSRAGVETHNLLGELEKRIGPLLRLIYNIRDSYGKGRWGLFRRITRAFEIYRVYNDDFGKFAPDEK